VFCSKCANKVEVEFDSDYYFEPRVTLKDLLCIIGTLLVLILMLLMLITYEKQQNDKLSHHSSISDLGIIDVFLMILVVLAGFCFWIASLAICFKRRLNIGRIVNTNQEIKVSAFEGIE
jgi:uncharacterized BrkB/YihY/UPF0761 family membrane protein